MNSKPIANLTKSIFKKRSFNVESLQDISLHIKKGNFQNILIVLGPSASIGSHSEELVALERNISGCANIVDNIQDDDFSRKKFQLDPNGFFKNVDQIYNILSDCMPSFTHFFLSQLQNSGILLRIYTLNVDGLEKVAGISEEKIIYLNGTLNSCHCSNRQCTTKYDSRFVKKRLQDNQIPLCLKCGNPVKPDIKFSEERIHYDYMKNFIRDANLCDLFLVVGTSLLSPATGEIIRMIMDEISGTIATAYINTEQSKLKDKFSISVIDECDKVFQILSMLIGWDDKIATLERNFYNKSLQS